METITQKHNSQLEILEAIQGFRNSIKLVHLQDGTIKLTPPDLSVETDKQLGILPPIYPERLGDRSFQETHGSRFSYVVGEMARGIATAEMVIKAAKAGLVPFFGSAGLTPTTIEKNIIIIQKELEPEHSNWGANLIHSPNEPGMENTIVDLFLRLNVRKMSASAFMSLTPAIVRYSATGLFLDTTSGVIMRRQHVFAKISRPEIAEQFMSPAPEKTLEALVKAGHLSPEEADLASRIPVAEDITVEADSGGHTDNRTLTTMFPTIAKLRDELSVKYNYATTIRLGAAGGLGTPSSVAAAYSLGAAYVVTGSINQSAVESGLSADGRKMLSEVGIADVTMAPAADMFERGVEVQVLKRGSLFAHRARWLYILYDRYDSLNDLSSEEKTKLENDILGTTTDDIWQQTQEFFSRRNPAEISRAKSDPKHLMALVFRWYLFQASQWSREGHEKRRVDYQIWCGPAMGAFNAWTKDSFLSQLENRKVVQIALNLLEGAAAVTRAQQLRSFGVAVPAVAYDFRPRQLKLS